MQYSKRKKTVKHRKNTLEQVSTKSPSTCHKKSKKSPIYVDTPYFQNK